MTGKEIILASNLPEDIKAKALANLGNSVNRYSLRTVIASGFVWSETPEGHDFWYDVYNKVAAASTSCSQKQNDPP